MAAFARRTAITVGVSRASEATAFDWQSGRNQVAAHRLRVRIHVRIRKSFRWRGGLSNGGDPRHAAVGMAPDEPGTFQVVEARANRVLPKLQIVLAREVA